MRFTSTTNHPLTTHILFIAQDETNASQIVEFSVDLPSKFTNYEHFVGIAESLIEKIEYYISSEGKFLADQSKVT